MIEPDFSFVDFDSWIVLLVGLIVLLSLKFMQNRKSKRNKQN